MKPKYELPTNSFPYKIPRRLCILSVPRPLFADTLEGMPEVTPNGVRKSALLCHKPRERIIEAAYPNIRRLLMTRRTYKTRFDPERNARIDRMLECVNNLCYTKMGNSCINIARVIGSNWNMDGKRKRGWTESEWNKHMGYISLIAKPKTTFQPPPVVRGKARNLADLMPRIRDLATVPEDKMYRRLSQENWYQDPLKVRKSALTYVITDRIRKMAKPKAVAGPPAD